MKYIDPHCHLFSEYFSEKEINNLILEAKENGVAKIIVPGCSEKDSLESIEVAKKYPNVFASIGIHPSEAKDKNVTNFMQKIDFKKIVALGEIGLDLHWKDNPPLKIQKQVFINQLRIAKKHQKPVIVHMRETEKETYDILSSQEFRNLKFVLHSFTGQAKWVKPFLDLNAYFSFSGIVTFKNAKEVKENALKVPLNKLMAETDTPYLSPTPLRGKTNKPANVKIIVDFLSQIREEEEPLVKKVIYQNTSDFFKI